jgi:hypothetical protein
MGCELWGFLGVEGLDNGNLPEKRGKIFSLYRHPAAIARAFSPQAYGGSDPGAAPQARIVRAVGPFQAMTRATAKAVGSGCVHPTHRLRQRRDEWGTDSSLGSGKNGLWASPLEELVGLLAA